MEVVRFPGNLAKVLEDEMEEDEVFQMYLDAGTVPKLVLALKDRLDQPKFNQMALYRWLHDEGRYARWRYVIKHRTLIEADEMVEIADKSTPETIQVDNLRVRARAEAGRLRSGGIAAAEDDPKDKIGNVILVMLKEVEDRVTSENQIVVEDAVVLENPVTSENPVSPENPTDEEGTGDVTADTSTG